MSGGVLQRELWVMGRDLKNGDILLAARNPRTKTTGSGWRGKVVGTDGYDIPHLINRRLEYLVRRNYENNEFGLEIP